MSKALTLPQMWWETTDPEAYYSRSLSARPLETEADLIAAAMPRGQVHPQPFMSLKDDSVCAWALEDYLEAGYIEEQARAYMREYTDHSVHVTGNQLGPAYGGKPMKVAEQISWLSLSAEYTENWEFWLRPSLWAD